MLLTLTTFCVPVKLYVDWGKMWVAIDHDSAQVYVVIICAFVVAASMHAVQYPTVAIS